MTSIWPEQVDRVAAFLRAAGARRGSRSSRRERRPPSRQRDEIGCELRQIVKSLVFVCDELPVVVLVPGDRRADLEKIRRAAGAATTRVARPDEVEAATGLPPGPSRPSLQADRVLVEQTLLAQAVVWVGAGSPRHMVALTPTELVRLARGEPMDVVEEPAYHSLPETDQGALRRCRRPRRSG